VNGVYGKTEKVAMMVQPDLLDRKGEPPGTKGEAGKFN
jgi:hypothetical protein